jgi:hypothetical protein
MWSETILHRRWKIRYGFILFFSFFLFGKFKGYTSYADALKAVINFDGICFKGKKLSLILKSKLIEPEFDDYEGWDKIFKEKIDRYQSLTVVFSMFVAHSFWLTPAICLLLSETFEKRPEDEIKVLFSECGDVASIAWKKLPSGQMVPPAFVTFTSFDAVRKVCCGFVSQYFSLFIFSSCIIIYSCFLSYS